MKIQDRLQKLHVGYEWGWDIFSLEDTIKYEYEGFLSGLIFNDCSMEELLEAIALIVNPQLSDYGFDFYGYIKSSIYESVLDKLIAQPTKENALLAKQIKQLYQLYRKERKNE